MKFTPWRRRRRDRELDEEIESHLRMAIAERMARGQSAGEAADATRRELRDAVLLRPLPYADPGRLVVILHRGENPVAPANFLDWRRQSRSFEAMGAAE